MLDSPENLEQVQQNFFPILPSCNRILVTNIVYREATGCKLNRNLTEAQSEWASAMSGSCQTHYLYSVK